MIRLVGLTVYPIKGCRGIELTHSDVTDRGLAHDRRMMIVDEEGHFVTQRQEQKLALIETALDDGRLVICAEGMETLSVPISPNAGIERDVQVWNDRCRAVEVGSHANTWLQTFLQRSVSLVYMPTETRRITGISHEGAHNRVGFADGYPFLIASQESLDDLNQRLPAPISMNRFRPNLVVAGCQPYAEDTWARFRIGDIDFLGAKPCTRCVVTTIDQMTLERSSEPLKTLAKYRLWESQTIFGYNLVHVGTGVLRLGDTLDIEVKTDSMTE